MDLFVAAKHYAERKLGHRLDARYHATWAQSPTIDYWETGTRNRHPSMYEYTSNFIWSNTVQQAPLPATTTSSGATSLLATATTTPRAVGLDRDYVGLVMAASTGTLNEVPYAYAAHWGMPDEVSKRRTALVSAFGAGGPAVFGAVQDMEHRDVSVLML